MRRAVCGIWVAAALLLAACGDNQSRQLEAEAYIARALTYRANHDARASLIELRNAVRRDPNHARAHALLGDVYMDLGDPISAEAQLRRARELGGDPQDWLPPLARSWVAQSKLDVLLRELEAGDSSSPQILAMTLYARGTAYLASGNPDAAETAFRDAAEADAANPMPPIGMARIRLRRGDLEDAGQWLQQAIAIAPDHREVIALKGDVAMAANRFEDAAATFAILRDQYPQNPLITLALAGALIGSDQIDAAIPLIDAVLTDHPDSLRAMFLSGVAANRSRDFELARQHAETVLARAPDHLPALALSGASSFALGSYEPAATKLESVLAATPDNAAARRMLSVTYMRLGQPQRAYDVLSPIRALEADDSRILEMLGIAAARTGDLEDGEQYLARAVELEPQSARLRARLGAVRVSRGNAEQGLVDLEAALHEDPELEQALVSLALAHLREGDDATALATAARLRVAHPDSALGLMLEGITLAERGDVQAAKQVFQEILAETPNTPAAIINLATLEARLDQPERALGILEEGVAATSGHPQVRLHLARRQANAGLWNEAEANLRAVIEHDAGNTTAKLMLAESAIRSGRLDDALALACEVSQADPSNVLAHDLAGRLSLHLGNAETAIEAFEHLVRLRPQSAQAHFLLAQAYRQAPDARLDLMSRQALERSLALAPSHLPTRFHLALALTREGDVERAKALLGELEAEVPGEPGLEDLRAEIAVREQRFDDAVAILQATAHAHPSTDRILRLSEIQRDAGDAAGARQTLETWLEAHPDDPSPRFFLANLDLREDRPDQARANYEKLIEHVPDSAIARNNLAWLLREAGQPRVARAHIDHALDMAPDDPRFLDTAGLIYLDLGDSDRALQFASDAARQRPEDGDIQFHLAMIQAERGNEDEARTILRRALSDADAFPRRDEARALLEQLENP